MPIHISICIYVYAILINSVSNRTLYGESKISFDFVGVVGSCDVPSPRARMFTSIFIFKLSLLLALI